METHTQEDTAQKAVQTFYTIVALICAGIVIIYPLAYLGVMYIATKLLS